MEKDNDNYQTAARYLQKGFGGMIVFGIKGGHDSAVRFINGLELFSHVANVGDAKSLAIHPASTTHSQLEEDDLRAAGVPSDLIRFPLALKTLKIF